MKKTRCLKCGADAQPPKKPDPMKDTVCLSCGFRWTVLGDTLIYSRGDTWKYHESHEGCLAVFSWEPV